MSEQINNTKEHGFHADVQITEEKVPFTRQLAAIVFAKMILDIFMYILTEYILKIVVWLIDYGLNEHWFFSIYMSYNYILFLPKTLLLIAILLLWRKMIKSGQKIWFMTIKPRNLFLIFIGLYILDSFVPYLIVRATSFKFEPPYMVPSEIFRNISVIHSFFKTVVMSLIWLWWFNSTPYRFRSYILSIIALLVYYYTIAVRTFPVYNIDDTIPGLIERVSSWFNHKILHFFEPLEWYSYVYNYPYYILLGILLACLIFTFWILIWRIKLLSIRS